MGNPPAFRGAVDELVPTSGNARVAVIIPCYNGRDFIAEAIASVQEQSCTSVDLVVVDDGSTDDSLAMIPRGVARVYRQQNSGVSSARNAGLRSTSAPYVVFLDADDRLHPHALATGILELEADSTITMTFGGNAIIDENGDTIGNNSQPPARFGFWEVLAGVTPGPSQCVFRRSSLEETGGFDQRFRHGEDWELYLRLSQLGPITCHGHQVSDYRSHSSQATRSPTRSFLGMLEVLDAVESRVPFTKASHARFQQARRHWARIFGQYLPTEAARALWHGDVAAMAQSCNLFVHHLPYSLVGFCGFVLRRLKRAH